MQHIKTQRRQLKAGSSDDEKTQRDIEMVSDLAGKCILLEIAMRLDLLPFLSSNRSIYVEDVLSLSTLPKERLLSFLDSLARTGLLESEVESLPEKRTKYRVTEEFNRLLPMAGYLAWTHGACRPLIDNAERFFHEPDKAAKEFVRDGRLVAVSSEWMGETGFYLPVLEIIERLKPERIVDLGCGSGRLLKETLESFPTATGIGIDMSLEACREAERNTPHHIKKRVQFLHQRIEELADDASCLAGADVISAAFVLHDLMPHDEETLNHILKSCSKSLSGGTLAITEISPYEKDNRRITFSTVVTLIHEQFMFRKIMGKNEWKLKLLQNGFKNVEFVKIPFPAGFVILAN